MANKRINIASLEFDQIKENLKEFLRGQEQFSDFDFEGSNMSVLLDVLAYNTHYNAMYMNMSLNEVFLDSASKRDSVVSLAKGLGYLPRSATSARTKVSFDVIPSASVEPTAFASIPKKTPFNGVIDGEVFSFYTTKDITAPYNIVLNKYVFTDIELVEGVPITNRIQYSADNRYLIPNPNLDSSTLTVRVQDTATSTLYETFVSASGLTLVRPDSAAYFLREVDSGYYELSFGDGILGKALVPGNVINLDYFISSNTRANGIKSLTYGGPLINGGQVTNVVLATPTSGGKAPETIEEIRYNAPNMYAAQNRAVTAKDYEAIILNKVPSIDSVIVWGGENNNPPVYGKVFISATTKSGNPLTYTEQQDIISNVINNYKIVGVYPEFMEPEYLRVELDVVIYYDATTTQKTTNDITTTATQLVLGYNNNELKRFNRIFRASDVARLIDTIDYSIVSSVIRLKLYKEVSVVYNKQTNYTVNIANPIEPESISCTSFFTRFGEPSYIYDDGVGNVMYYSFVNNNRVERGKIGTVDYESGVIRLENLAIVNIGTSKFEIICRSTSPSIVSAFNQVVSLDTQKLKVNTIVDQTTQGRVLSGNKFIFTSNKI